MNSKDLRLIGEAYNNIDSQPEQLDEGIVDALKKGVKAVLGPANQSPEAEAARMGARRPKTELQKKVAGKTAEVLKKEDADMFDLVKGYLLDEGHADSEEEALHIMANMTEESRTEIVDFVESKARSREFEKRLPADNTKARSREFEHGSTRSMNTPSKNLGDGMPRDKKGNIMY